MKPAVFLDKDGTLVEDVPYNAQPSLIRLLPGVREALGELHGAGFELVLVTNQSGVARGYFPEEALSAVEARLRELIQVPLAGFYYCPHHPAGCMPGYAIHCACRKPAPGLLLRAAREQDIDLARSWFVGDILNDVEAGRRAGCRTILVDNGGETQWLGGPLREPHHVVDGFGEAARLILAAAASPRLPAPCPESGLTVNHGGAV